MTLAEESVYCCPVRIQMKLLLTEELTLPNESIAPDRSFSKMLLTTGIYQ